ncbi:UDP-galactose transporter [Mycotypha africana]|uniref:UDP-galactose transporter n=1 Tax=Mycotypha africana TaxID=64632 RepID=UPI0023008947|nr:UDP-galactose transporter [Mycotypha africana]KAI8977345.1 UDP-galactose transporter [Mycotypha africana]
MRYTRASVSSDKLYLASTAVLMSEIIKTICFFIAIYFLFLSTFSITSSVSSLSSSCINLQYSRRQRYLIRAFKKTLIIQWRETLKLAIPAVLYLIQNNLQYVAATNLDAATFQVTYQFKTLTTAFFSVVMLNRKLSHKQWIALALLTVGIAFVVLPKSNSPQYNTATDNATIGNQFNMEGLLSVSMACILSGVAGVYFEKVFYGDNDDEQLEEALSYWIRNMQLSMSSVLLAAVFAVGIQDGSKIIENGFFQNYSYMTWIVIFIQAAGGIIVGLVMRYADNILKGFATSISILISSMISYGLFEFQITSLFIVGAAFVIYATYLYSN